MITALLRAEFFKLNRRLMTRVLLLILVIGVAGLYALLLLSLQAGAEGVSEEQIDDLRQSLRVAAVPEMGLSLVQTIGTVLAVILAVSIISSEYSWGTIRVLLPRAGSRSAVLTAKLVLLVGFAILVVVLGYLVALAASYVVSLAEDLSTDLGQDFILDSLGAIGRTAYTMLPYVALGFFIAVFTRSTAAGIAITLSVLFLEGIAVSLINSLGDPFDRIPEALIAENVSAVMSANAVPNGDDLGSGSELPNPWQGAAVLAVYTAVFTTLAYQRFLTRDITSG